MSKDVEPPAEFPREGLSILECHEALGRAPDVRQDQAAANRGILDEGYILHSKRQEAVHG
jgi:hypothetical protein